MLSSFLLSISLSIDSFGIGITYGLRDTIITKTAKAILFIISLIVTTISISLGNILSNIFSPEITNFIGAAILIIMGVWIILQSTKNNDINDKKAKVFNSKPIIYNWFIKSLGITIQIIRDPIYSDLDNSKKIDSKEALYLGLALSLDSLCIGIAVSTLGFSSFLFVILVATFQLIFLTIGSILGKKLIVSFNISNNIFTVISGVILIIIGITKIF